jgi:hypothetical protein
VEPTTIRQKQRTWTGVVDRPEFVVVRREDQTFPGVLFEWRRRTERDGLSRRSARVIYLDADNILRQSWFPESSIEPAPHAVAHEPRMVG